MAGLRLIVRAIGKTEHFFTVDDPTVIPRVGEHVEFSDGRGYVSKVTWKPLAKPTPIVEVVCQPWG